MSNCSTTGVAIQITDMMNQYVQSLCFYGGLTLPFFLLLLINSLAETTGFVLVRLCVRNFFVLLVFVVILVVLGCCGLFLVGRRLCLWTT